MADNDLDGDLVIGSIVLMGEISWCYEIEAALVLPAVDVLVEYDIVFFLDGSLDASSPFVVLGQTQPIIVWFATIYLSGTLYTGSTTIDCEYGFEAPGPVDLSGVLTTPAFLLNQLLPLAVSGPVYQLSGTLVLGALTMFGEVTVVDPDPLAVSGDLVGPSVILNGAIEVYSSLFTLSGALILSATVLDAEIESEIPPFTLTAELTTPSVRIGGLLVSRHFVVVDTVNRRIAVDQPWS
jgi:hypothetical protein